MNKKERDIQATGTRHFSPTASRSSGNYMAKKIFRNPQAQRLLEKKASDPDVWEYGVDDIGQIYFAYANGVVERYTRREFIKLAKDEEDWKEEEEDYDGEIQED